MRLPRKVVGSSSIEDGGCLGHLLLASGLGTLRTASIAAALPISFVLTAMIWGLLKSLHDDPSAVLIATTEAAPDGTKVA